MNQSLTRSLRLEEGTLTLTLYAPADPAGCPQLWLPVGPEDPEPIARGLRGVVLAAVSGADWNRDLSPWPAPRAFRSGQDFSGGAEAFLDVLTGKLLPRADRALGCVPRWRGIGGYSLAGLFALWSLCRTGCFRRAASVSGSLWFDGFPDFFRENLSDPPPEGVYLSLGRREGLARNPRLARVAPCTRDAAAFLAGKGVPVRFEWNEGGHFCDPAGRLLRGLTVLSEDGFRELPSALSGE